MKHNSGRIKTFRTLALAAGTLTALWSPLRETTTSVYLGASHISSSDVRIRQPATSSDAVFRGVSWDSDSFTNPVFYGVRFSHFFQGQPTLGIGPDFTHDKVFARTDRVVQVDGTWNGAPVHEAAPMNQRVQSFSISHGVNTLALNGYHRWSPLSDSLLHWLRCKPYAGGGPAYYVLHAENTVDGQHNEEGYTGGGFGYQLLAGLHFRIMPLLGVFIEAKHNRGSVEVNVAGGRAETTLKSTQLFVGLSLGF